MSLQITTDSADQTINFGKQLAKYLKAGDIVCLQGDLGSGKTTLVKGVAQGLKISQNKVTSPTFVLMNIYEGKLPLYHFDFYRLENIQEIAAIGYDEFIYGSGIAMIEWAERFGPLAPKENLKVEIQSTGEQARSIQLSAQGQRYEEILRRLK